MLRTRGFSLIELLIVVAIILVIAAIAVPRLLQARIAANEASAVSALRTITNAEIIYRIHYGTYTGLGDLHEEGIIDAHLGTAPHQKSGYSFSATGDENTFAVQASPVTDDVTGRRSFCSDTPAYVRYSEGADCDPSSSPALQ